MKEIMLTQGKVARVDDEDFLFLSQSSWYAHQIEGRWYACRGNMEYMHRVLCAGDYVDHRDGDGLNNTRGNLRTATNQQNARNAKRHRDGSSQYKGVYRDNRRGKWVAQIGLSYRSKQLGRFSTEAAAARAYNSAAIEHFGDFARLNVVCE